MTKNYLLKIAFLVLVIASSDGWCAAQASQFNVAGNAVSQGGSCFQITTTSDYQASSAWYNTPVNIHQGFDLRFRVFMGNFNPNSEDNSGTGCGPGADGMCFVLQNTNTGVYTSGSGLGYGGFPNQSLGIELDTYQNGWDPFYSHIAIEANGQVEHPVGTLAGPVQMSNTKYYTADGNWHLFEVIWNPKQDSISVFFDSVFRVGYNFDSLGGLFNGLFQGLDSSIYWGFTGATGLYCNLTEFCVDSLCLNVADLNIGADTTYCDNFTRVLTTGNVSAVWSTGETANQITVNQPGTYWASVNTCAGVVADTVHIRQSIPALLPQAESASCGNNNGGIVANPTAGIAPFTYNWNTGPGSDSLLNLSPGNYKVTITDSYGCSASAQAVVITSGTPVTLQSHTAEASCGLSNGTIYVQTTTGSSPFNYQWNTGAATDTLANVSAGSYTITATGNDGCSASRTINLASAGAGVVLSYNSLNASCGKNNGSISLTVDSGTAPFNYDWNTGTGTTMLYDLGPGTYTVTVTGAANCSAVLSASIISTGNSLSLQIDSANASCSANNGSITIIPTSGTAPFTFVWSTGGTNDTLANLSPGTYAVTITDSTGCTASASTNIISTSNIALQWDSVNATCGESNGSIIITATSGTAPFTYQWNTGYSSDTLLNIAAGLYIVTVTDFSGCSNTASISISTIGGPILQLDSVTGACANNNGSISVTTTSGTAPFTYSWNNGQSASTATHLSAGTYTLTVSDQTGCVSTLSATVNAIDSNATITTPKTVFCAGDSVIICASPGYTGYRWNTGQTGMCVPATEPGLYVVTVSLGANCIFVSNQIEMEVLGSPSISVSISGDTLVNYGSAGSQWYLNGTAISGATDSAFIATQPGVYTVVSTNDSGCTSLSNSFTVSLTDVAGVQQADGMRIYPDPVYDNLNISYILKETTNLHISICDVTGRQVKEVLNEKQAQGNYIQQVNTNTLSSGVYILNFATDNSAIGRRFVKVN